MIWYYTDDTDSQVSIEESQLPELVASQAIKPTTLVWNESMTEWQPCSEVRPDLFGGDPLPPSLSSAQPGNIVAAPQPEPGLVANQSKTDSAAVCALIFGIIGIPLAFGCLPILFSIPGIICGHIALTRVKAGNSTPINRGLGLGGLITGYIGLAIGLIWVSFFGLAMIAAVASEM